jgi:hypothetical protein
MRWKRMEGSSEMTMWYHFWMIFVYGAKNVNGSKEMKMDKMMN